MKKFITSFFLVVSVSFSGCSDSFLSREPLTSLSNETFWETEQDAMMGLVGTYDAMQTLYAGGPWGVGFIQLEGLNDNAYFNWGNGFNDLARGIATAQNGKVEEWWAANYQGIVRANRVLANVPSIEMNETEKDRILAEAKFLRAHFYLQLAMTFENVPLILKPQTIDESNVPKSDRAKVFDQIIKDFEEAAEVLPIEISGSERGRATKGAALGMLTRTYLYNKMWNEAATTAKEIIENFNYSLHPDYQELFTLAGENSSEILFSIPFERGIGEGEIFGRWIGVPPPFIAPLPALINAYYCIDGKPIDESPLYKGDLSKDPSEDDLIYLKSTDRYENRDPRLDMTIVRNEGLWLGEPIETYYTRTNLHFRKWAEESDADQTDGAQDFYTIRYADILLMRAEAMVMSGNYSESEVVTLINQVRQRPGVMMPRVQDVEGAGLSQTELIDVIKHERRIEFAYEGTRYYDLKRWGDLEEAWTTVWAPQERTYIGPSSTIWPIPQDEMDNNPNLEQNSEWE